MVSGWKYESIGNMCQISTGIRNTQDNIKNGKYPFFVRSDKVERINTYTYDGEAVLTAGDGVGVGKVVHYINGKFDFHQRVYKMSDFKGIDGKYFYYCFKKFFYNRVKSMSAKNSVDSVRLDMIRDMKVLIPNDIEEQKAIANTLTNIDNLIDSLQKVIEKKENIRDGALIDLMNQDNWEEQKLDNILKYEQPTKYIVENTEYSNSGVPVLTAGKTFILGYTNEKNGIYNKGKCIIFDDFTTAIKKVDFKFKVRSSAMKILTSVNKDYDLDFIYYAMQLIKYEAKDHKRHWISTYGKFLIRIPEDVNKQKDVSRKLVNMDNEIEKLKQKLEKYKQIKEGMMEDLLTGKVRLNYE